MFGHPRGLDRRGRTSQKKYNSPEQSAQDSCNWRTSALPAQFSEKTSACRKKRCAEYYTALYRLPDSGASSHRENSYGLAELTVRPPLIPRAVDGQGGAGMLDIDEEHLAVGREGRAGEFGIVHAVVPEAVDLACGRYAD